MTHHNTVFAQMLKFIPTCLSLPAAGRHRSTTYIPVGVHPCRRALSPHTGLPVHK